MAVQIQLRRDTASNWTTNNPTPAEGELCIEKDTIKIKFGDGVTDWNNLPYFGAGGSTPSSLKIETFIVDSTIISNGYLPLTEDILPSEPHMINMNGLLLFEGSSEDFTIDDVGNRIVFTSAQLSLLTVNDKIQVTYMYK
jgi:hypothetical protein